ncbi:M2 family metallopeptidase [Sphingosinicella microcystinivorans]|uniref:Peptidase M2 n=1 Tax=Sphingosinicella microcystinivorans TaxID=335406 RepID=A0AAD1D4A9_SPHMI|nr:M2 family metallopeptidase [Sphingosinicella microcystinivorans]RKS90693.1 peptidyl-dipeptidase A [Sphingosinicella microcystinivorans]BBE33607.1 peptidase M2 [Sphingosinicella microcystinivorans]
MKHLTSAIALAAMLLATGAAPAPTAADADAFVAKAEKDLEELGIFAARAAWVNATYITDDTDILAARTGAAFTEAGVRYASEAAKYAALPGLSYDTKRKLDMLRQGLVAPAPNTPGAADTLSTLLTGLQSAYGKGKGTYKGEVKSGNDLEELMGTERDPELLKEMWVSWHKIGVPMRNDYTQFVSISNAGSKELGYVDTGAQWRAGYDMDPDAFAKLTDDTWNQVKPLYDQLHCYTRAKLNEKYGDAVQPKTGPIRADLLGNMWAQEWGNIYDIVAPKGAGDVGYDLTELLAAKGYTPEQIVKTGEGFFSSVGFAPLPQTFWQRSMITAPRDREVVCHASAWDIDNKDDIRIKMCTKVNGDDFVTVHHELGHNYYQRAYNQQPFLYMNSANDGFHEAVGDFIALSVTPDYLVKIGLLDPKAVPSADKDIGLLLKQAMDKVAFLPFGLLIDKWRWGVFSGQITPNTYNKAWNDLRLQYQGIVPPVPRSEADFDPGAKYHIPGNTPYTRYFLARLLQFQFHQAACKQAGWKGPLHRCSIYGDKKVGEKLNAMLEMGASKPWPDALQAFTGSRQMDGKAMIAYFQPLMTWLQKQNKGKTCGW